ncbi:toprim domain-containing protein [Parvimonas micra]
MSYEDSSKINILDVARDLGFNPIPVSNNIYKDKTHDSLRFWTDTNSFCWYSKVNEINVKGSSFNLVQFVKNMTFPEAKKYLINKGFYTPENYKKNYNYNKNNLNYFKKNSSEKQKSFLEEREKQEEIKLKVPPFNTDLSKMINYFKNERKIEPSTVWKLIKNHKVLAFDKLDNICFFATNKEGQWKNITKRRIDTKEFFASKGGDKNYPFVINNKAKDILVCEGEIDAISCYEMFGNKFNYISIPATTDKGLIHHIEENNIKNTNIFLLMDNDEAGIKSSKIIAENLEKLNRNLKVKNMTNILLDNVKDPNELLIKKKQNLIEKSIKKEKIFER